jgi:hypothetical protein
LDAQVNRGITGQIVRRNADVYRSLSAAFVQPLPRGTPRKRGIVPLCVTQKEGILNMFRPAPDQDQHIVSVDILIETEVPFVKDLADRSRLLSSRPVLHQRQLIDGVHVGVGVRF